MHVTRVQLTDFRSYEHVDITLEPGASAFVGPNGQGKTNLVEALRYTATLGSHRVAADAPLVRVGADRAVVRVAAVHGERTSIVEIEINPGRANRARLNRSPARRPRDVLGAVRTVLFAPEDLSLVKGDPAGRRTFLDELVVQASPRMAGVIADHERILRQRNALLKSAGGLRRSRRGSGGPDPASSPDLTTLDVWDTKAARTGAELLAARLRLVTALRPHVEHAYAQVADGSARATTSYRSSVHAHEGSAVAEEDVDVADLEQRLAAAMNDLRGSELDRGVSLVGPHRDDLDLGLGDLPAKGYASHGESWSLALALRLASYQLLTHGVPGEGGLADWGEDAEPVLILDDVFAELDVRRRERLAALVSAAEQVLVTAAVPHDVPAELVGARYDVADGQVRRVG